MPTSSHVRALRPIAGGNQSSRRAVPGSQSGSQCACDRHGSWAARYEGIAGRAPHDVDVLVIGEVPRRYLYEAAERAEQRLGLPVNPVLCSLSRWFAASDPLIQQIRSAPVVWVVGDELREGEG
jgi:hypothetical protein